MTTFFADRGTLFANSKELAFVKSVKLTIDESITRVDTMSRDYRSAGYKKGNRKVSGSFEVEIPDQKAQIDLAFLYKNDITMVAAFGTNGERFTLIGIVQTSQDLNGGVGDTGKSISFEAIDAVNENGSSVNAVIGF